MAEKDESRAEGFAMIALFTAMVSVVLMAFGVFLGVRALDEVDSKSTGVSTASSTVAVTLSEFKIEPGEISVATGGTVTVTNKGTTQHDFTVIGTDTKTPLIDPGKSAELSLAALPAGDYQVMCSVAGHADSGMTAQLKISGGGGAAAGGGTTATTTAAMTPEQMDAAATARVKAFPAKTQGKGAVEMQPEVAADGTKVFNLTASVFDWEVEPGRVVKAWGYNGTVPGPTIKVNSGDKVRIVLKNELPESTSIHFHGIEVPNSQDGVPDVTQPQIKQGETFTYEFTAIGPAVGMYHAHSNSQIQVPKGLLGPFIIDDMPLPAGMTADQQINMVLNDAGDIGMSINGKSFPATDPIVAKLGSTFLVNYFNEGFLIHPMHLHGPNQLVIAKDGNPLPAPYKADTLLIAPGERYTVLVTPNHVGTWVFHCHILNHAEKSDGFYGMTTALVVQE